MGKRQIFDCADAIISTLSDLGVRCVFGMPGTQNVKLFESLRHSNIQTVLATSELTAGFMANGWFRASGQPGVFLVTLGPGFAWAVPPLAEAALDSAAIILITIKPNDRGYNYDLQVINQRELASAIGIPVFDIEASDSLTKTVSDAWVAATRNGPRPVIIQVSTELLNENWPLGKTEVAAKDATADSCESIEDLLNSFMQAKRPVILAGGGTIASAHKLEQLVETRNAIVLTTPTARGVIPESHRLCLGVDLLRDSVHVVNRVLESADIVLALGCRFSHNGTGGFKMLLAEDKLAHVDADCDVLQGNYPARWPVCMDVGRFLDTLLQKLSAHASTRQTGWHQSEVDNWRTQMHAGRKPVRHEPRWKGHGDCRSLFRRIRDGVPKDGIIVTDTGLHQILARSYLDVFSPSGLIFPSDLQSMGFGLPAAVGAALATPDRATVAIIGDGSLLMIGAELLTAKREGLALPVLVFCDGSLGQIRAQQIARFGHDIATRIEPMDLAAFSASFGVEYVVGDANIDTQLQTALGCSGPTVIEIQLEDSQTLMAKGRTARIKNTIKSAIGPKTARFLKR